MRKAALLLIVIAFASCSPLRRIDLVSVEAQLRELLELHTYEHLYRNVVYFGEEKSFLFFRTMDREVLFSIEISVRAGIDLAKGLEITRDRLDATRIYVAMPAAEVLSVDADEASIREYFVRERGGRIGLADVSGQIESVKEATAADAVERGITLRARENAERIVRDFLALAGFTTVVFTTPPAGPAEIRG